MFSPYYAWAQRRGRGDPLNHCAVNVALYGKSGKRWAMTERPRHSVSRVTDAMSIGPSSVSWDGTALMIAIDEMTVPFPSRIRGTVRVLPSALTQQDFTLNAFGNHRWWPIAPRARVEITLESPALRWQGDGYLDMNSGDAPLEDGFTTWQWARTATRNGAAVLYEAQHRGGGGVDLALSCKPSGEIEAFDPPALTTLKRTGWRVGRNARSDAQQAPRVLETLEDAPFYARSTVAASLLGEPVTLMHESLSLDRFRMPVVQAMLPFRMPRARR